MVRNVLRVLFAIAGIVVGLWILYTLRAIIVYLILAALLTLLGRPVQRFLKKLRIGRFRLPSALCAVLTLLFFIAILAGIFALFVPLLVEEGRLLSHLRLQDVKSALMVPVRAFNDVMSRFSHNGTPLIKEDYLIQRLTTMIGSIDFSKGLNILAGILGNFFVAAFSVLFISFFFLKDKMLQKSIIDALTPEKYLDRVHETIEKIKVMLSRYLIGLLIQFVIFVAVVSIGLLIVGIKYAFLIGVIAGLLNLVPYIGPLIGAAFGIFIGISTNIAVSPDASQLLPLVLEVALVFAIAQFNDNTFVQPFIFANTAKSHPVEIYLVVIAAGTLAGVVGMVLAIPAYTIIKVCASEFLSQFKAVKMLTKNY